MSNGEMRQQFLADAIQHYLDRTADENLPLMEQITCSTKYEALKNSPYVLYVLKPTSGDDYLVYKLIQNYSNEYTKEVGMMTINSRQIVTLKRKGLDFHVEHEVDMRGGLITVDLSINDLRKCDDKEAGLFFKCFEKLEQTLNTNLAWCLT